MYVKELKEIKPNTYRLITDGRIYALQYSNFLEVYTLTDWDNYTARIKNARKVHEFHKRDGFETIEDVIECIETCW